MTAPTRHLTVRGIPSELARALEKEKRARGGSLNQTVIDLLRDALGLDRPGPPTNGLERLAGTWSDEDIKAMATATAPFEQVDEELWR